MRVYYFDDSGERRLNKDAPFFIMGGFGIDADQVPVLGRAVKGAAAAYGLTLSHPAELKFNHVGRLKDNDRKPQWMLRAGITERAKRRALVYTVLRSALQVKSVRVIIVAVDQTKTYGAKTPIQHALQPLLERVNMDLSDASTCGMVVMDEEQTEDKGLREQLRGGSLYMNFDRLIDTVSFMPSEESPGIQVADLIAGSFNRYLNQNDPGFARVIWRFLRESYGRRDGYGLKLYPRGTIEAPAPRYLPWTETDRTIHQFELAAGGHPLTWLPDGAPSLAWTTDWDFRAKEETGGS